ncbi:MAG: hypothetical protein JNM84_14970 [Planctomycetes bacterium]|nr:hypothetical protein [Planctomycetota bacterium]
MNFRPCSAAAFALCSAVALMAQEPAVELVVKDAEKEIVALEAALEKLRPGDRSGGQQLVRRLDLVGRKLGSARDRSTALWKDLAARHAALGKAVVEKANASSGPTLDAAALQQLDTEVSRAGSELRALALERFGEAALIESWRQRTSELRAKLAPLAAIDASDRRVRALTSAIDSLEQSVTRGVATLAASQRTRALDAQLQEIVEGYRAEALPRALATPLEPSAVEAWARAMRELLEQRVPRDLAEIEGIGKDEQAPRQRVESARHWIGSATRRELEQRLQMAQALLDGSLQGATRDAEFVLAIDASKPHDVANKLLGEGRLEENQARLVEGAQIVAAVKAFDAALGRAARSELDELAAKIARAEEHLRQSALAALSSVRMPAARSEDPALLEAAATTLKHKDYGIPGWERLVINAAPQRKERWETSVSPGVVTTRLTTVHFVWDEFQVTTAEKVGEEHYLFYNRLKFFHSAGSTTPTGRWILSERFRSTRILPEHIQR